MSRDVAASAELSGAALLRLGRTDPEEARMQLARLSLERQVQACLELRPGARGEFLMLLERPEEVVPLLPETELCITLRAGGIPQSAWLLAVSTAEQRQACFDLDCWHGLEFLPERALEWLDGLIEMGPDELPEVLDQVDLEVWVLALRSITSVAVLDKDSEPPARALSVDGVVWWLPGDEADAARVRQIAYAMYERSSEHYWRVVHALLYENPSECEEYALRWRTGRLADFGFPEPEQAIRVYRPLQPDDAPVWEVPPLSSALVPRARLPAVVEGTLLGEALSRLTPARASDVFSYVLAVANSLAVADRLPLSDARSVPRAVEKAVRGIDAGLRELVARRNQPAEQVLDQTLPLDLFRIGATFDPTLRER